MNKKYLLKNATIYDGSGSNPFKGNLLINNGKIEEIGNIDNVDAEVIDIKNKALSPGFIDMHAHDDIAMFVYPDMDFKLMQGVTTNVNGNCGSGVIPHSSADIINWHPNFDGIPEWSSYGEYLELVDKSKTSIHSAFLVGHGPIRKATTGNEKRMPTQSEFDVMKAWIKEGMEEGAVGFSTGLIYEPGRYSNTEELIELAKVISSYNGVYFSHMRNEAGHLIRSIEETIRIGEEAGCSIEISHHKVSGQENWGKSVESLNSIEEARSRGLNVHSDQYPYNAGSTSLFAVVQNNAFNEIIKNLPDLIKSQYLQIWQEYQENNSIESKLVHQIDKLEMVLQANIYKKDGHSQEKLESFFESAKIDIIDPKLKELFTEIIKEGE